MSSSAYLESGPDSPARSPIDLDAHRGVLACSVYDLPHIDPNRRITLSRLAMNLGRLVNDQIMMTDEDLNAELGIGVCDIERSAPDQIERNILVPKSDPQYDRGQQLTLVNPAVRERAAEAFPRLPFETESDKQPGVAFSPGDYMQFLIFPGGLQRRSEAGVLNANKDSTDAVELMRRPRSVQAKAVLPYIKKLQVLDARYASETELIRTLLKQTHGVGLGRTPQNQFLARNLDVHRQAFEGMYYETIENAGRTRGWMLSEVIAVHKADVKRRYLAESPEATDRAWQAALKLQGRYTIARRYMIMQYLDLYGAKIKRFIPYVKDEFYAPGGLAERVKVA